MLEFGDPNSQVSLRDSSLALMLVEKGLDDMDQLSRPTLKARVLDIMGNICLQYNLWDRSSDLYQQSLALRQSELGSEHPDLAKALNGLGNIGYNAFEYEEAEEHFRWALRTVAHQSDQFGEIRAKVRRNLGHLLLRDGRVDEARELYASNLSESSIDSAMYVRSLEGLVRVDIKTGNVSAASSNMDSVFGLKYALYDSLHQEIANASVIHAELLRKMGDPERAIRSSERAEAIYRHNFGEEHIAVGNARLLLGDIYREDLARYDSAASYYRSALDSYSGASLPPDHVLITRAALRLSEMED
jgi:tetratricopeptide (TPR) repeat protein